MREEVSCDMAESPAALVQSMWKRLSPVPGGSWLFSRLLGRLVPYSGSISPHIRELEPGFARVTMADRRAVRNHLYSIHAIALVNLGEVTSGLAMLAGLPSTVRSIVTGLTAEFLKKGRGQLTAICRCSIPASVTGDVDQVVVAEITDQSNETVARVRVTWRLSPVPPR
jgi:acyl-coenzyme A thioesterase PaaI-like protein